MKVTRELFQEIKSRKIFKGKIITDSMEPVIKTGEDIIVLVGEKNLSRFDIIVFFQNETLVCHYLWQKNKIVKPILMQTRNMRKEPDFPVSEEDYLGKVTSHKIGFFRKLSLFF